LDYASVEDAMRRQEAVISALGHKQFFRPTRILSDGTRNILRAMEAHGVSRFVCETSLGIGDSAGRMGASYTLFVIPLILPFYFWDKTRQERLIAASGAEWIIVRPGALTNGERRGTYRHGRHVGHFLGTARISRADVADFMLNQVADDRSSGRARGVLVRAGDGGVHFTNIELRFEIDSDGGRESACEGCAALAYRAPLSFVKSRSSLPSTTSHR